MFFSYFDLNFWHLTNKQIIILLLFLLFLVHSDGFVHFHLVHIPSHLYLSKDVLIIITLRLKFVN